MELVVIESPYAGDLEGNVRYLKRCMLDSLGRGESPFASHLLYAASHVLDDARPEERAQGMRAGFDWMRVADRVVVYTDLGISGGMEAGIARARRLGKPVEYRSLGTPP